ncbi:MAG: AzlD domain-containing protein [Deltaproteobacteria bacterium]|jgi:branched-subunit amino acid transport protein|nr:AzlD domain-containing protein [Deltaproteobacteria bacterium]
MEGYWLALMLATGGTMVLRAFFFTVRRPLAPPPKIADAMEFVPVSILAALVSNEFLLSGGTLFPKLAAALGAILLAMAFARDILTIAGGLAVYWVLDMLNIAPF